MATTYTINSMRVVRVSEKISAKHPERVFTVYGNFFKDGEKLSITSKVIERDDIADPNFFLDINNGILTLSEGQKGRKKSISMTQDDIEAELEALRNS